MKKPMKIELSSNRHFLFYSPDNRAKEMPLILFYHGKLGTAEKYLKKSNWIQLAEELKFVVCFAQAQGTPYKEPMKSDCYDDSEHSSCVLEGDYWWEVNFPEADLRFFYSFLRCDFTTISSYYFRYTLDIIDDVKSRCDIDVRRIHALGFSQGFY